MTCPRCQGLLVPETVHDGAYSEDLLRCVNCGRMGDGTVTPTTRTDQQTAPRRCAQCKAMAIPGQVLCAPHRAKWRAYMMHRDLRLRVKAKGFKLVLTELNERLMKIEAQRNYLLTNRKQLGA